MNDVSNRRFAYPAEIPSIDKFRGALSFAISVTVNLGSVLVALLADVGAEETAAIVGGTNLVVDSWLVVLFMVWRP
jgi:hypothetical protein